MTKHIEKLTNAQRAAMKSWADKWIAIGLSTEPADRPRAEAAYRACYRFANQDDTVPIIWVSSPIVGGLAAPIAAGILYGREDSAVDSAVESAVDFAVESAVFSDVDFAVESAVYSAVESAVRSAVDFAIHSAVRSAVEFAVDSAVYSAVGSDVESAMVSAVESAVDFAVESAVFSAVYSDVRFAIHSAVEFAAESAVDSAVYSAVRSAGLKIRWHNWLGGQFWPSWPAYERFFSEVCELQLSGDLCARAIAYAETTQAAGYWWPNKHFIMACERPRHIKRDDRGRLHSETGNAIEWRDGWGISSWHGTMVPGEWITDRKSLTPSVALRHSNIEQRRAACEILGWANVLEAPELHPRIINVDEPYIGTLVEVDLPNAPEQRFLKYRCATGRWFAESVNDKSFDTALKANAGGNGWRGKGDPMSFIPFIRT